MFPLAAIGAGLGLGKAFVGLFQNGQANKINPNYVPYKISPYAQQRLGIAEQMFNGRMAGAANAENNIAANQADAFANIGRNATDSSTALAMGAGVQGMSNNAYSNLADKEGAYKLQTANNLNSAYDAMTEEERRKWEAEMGKYNSDMQAKAQNRGAAFQNIFGGLDQAGASMVMGQILKGGGGGLNNGLGGGSSYYNTPQFQSWMATKGLGL